MLSLTPLFKPITSIATAYHAIMALEQCTAYPTKQPSARPPAALFLARPATTSHWHYQSEMPRLEETVPLALAALDPRPFASSPSVLMGWHIMGKGGDGITVLGLRRCNFANVSLSLSRVMMTD